MPIGIIGSLVVCTALYILFALVLTGMVPYQELDEKAAVSEAFARVGMGWAKGLIAAAALAGLTSVILVGLLGSSRVLMAMSRDGLLPPAFLALFGAAWSGNVVGMSVSEFDPGRDVRDTSLNLLGWLVEYVLLKAAKRTP